MKQFATVFLTEECGGRREEHSEPCCRKSASSSSQFSTPVSAVQAGLFWAHKVVTAGVLVTGATINVIALIVGMDAVVSTVFTTKGETVLTATFFTAFVLGVLAERYVPVAPGWRRVVRRAMTVYMLALTLAHGVNNLLLHNQEGYAAVFSGPFYTYPAIVVLGGLAIVIATAPPPGRPSRELGATAT